MMAKSNEITRTLLTTTVTVMCVDPEAGTNEDYTVQLAGPIPQTNVGLLRKLARLIPQPYRPVLIRHYESEYWTYVMSENEFIRMAEKRRPRLRIHEETEPETDNNEEEEINAQE